MYFHINSDYIPREYAITIILKYNHKFIICQIFQNAEKERICKLHKEQREFSQRAARFHKAKNKSIEGAETDTEKALLKDF